MARTRKLTKRTSTRLTTPTPAACLWRRNQAVLRLTNQILELDQSEARGLTDTLVQIGRRLRTVHVQLDHGQWLDWVEDAVPFAPRRAHAHGKTVRRTIQPSPSATM